MVAGELPFDDACAQGTLLKVAFEEPQYPSFMSAQLTDLLRKILVKNPEKRLTLGRIKDHPWFSRSEYMELL
jgi:serine/threonine protein kinase